MILPCAEARLVRRRVGFGGAKALLGLVWDEY
jgi:hypothetical protein